MTVADASPSDDDLDWDNLGFVRASTYRMHVVRTLTDGPAIPSAIATDDVRIAKVSRALAELRERNLVELLVDEDTRKGRYYGLTPQGEPIADHIAEEDR